MKEVELHKKTDSLVKGLLDTGKRTNLINYRENKSSTIEIVYPSVEKLFDLVVKGQDLTIKNYSTELKRFLKNKDDEKNHTTADFIKDKINSTKSNELLIDNSLVDDPFLTIKKLIKKNRYYINETGINLCYVALGFVKWKDKDRADRDLLAPLLLVPISITPNQKNTAFNINFLSDDIITNGSLLLKFKSDFYIDIPEFSFDAYSNISEYFAKVEEYIKHLDFSVTNKCSISLFSFSNINIYNDITENMGKLLENDNVRLLLGDDNCESLTYIEDDKIRENKETFLKLHNVVDADSSQMMAILNAKKGNTFVLQGPPGTGKSQTITNIIAESLYDGKTVLFVSEKQAALNVVFEKLKKIGLQDSCLELHSEKSNKKEVIAELARTLNLDNISFNDEANNLLEERDELSRTLDKYSDELHSVNPALKMTLYELYEEAYKHKKAPEINYIIPDIASKDSDYINNVTKILEYYINYSKTIGDDYHKNIWYGFTKTSVTRTDLIELENAIKETNTYLYEINNISDNLLDSFCFNLKNINDAKKVSNALKIAFNSSMLCPSLVSKLNDSKLYDLLTKMIETVDIYKTEKQKLDSIFDKDIYNLNGKMLYKKASIQYSSFFSRLFSKEFKSIKSDLRMCTKDGHKLKYQELCDSLLSLANFQEAKETFNEMYENNAELFIINYKGVDSDFESLLKELEELKEIDLSNEALESLSLLDPKEYQDSRDLFLELHNQIEECSNDFNKTKEYLDQIIDASILDFDEYNLDELTSKFDVLSRNIDVYSHWGKFMTLYGELKKNKLLDFINLSINKKLPPVVLVSTYKKIFFHEWIDEYLKECPNLSKLPRNMHDEVVKKFQSCDRVSLEVNKAKIRGKLSKIRPSMKMVSKGSAVARILRENEKKRRKMPIKDLFATVPGLILQIKPCLLMSPLSVSTYLPADLNFDLIVFDEASQILPGHALGPLYRGKQHIIVGDSKQMPPTSFFSSTFIENDNAVEDTVNDYESILDLASAAYPTVSLKWHYRSHYEQLIAFSNKNFYRNSLI